MLEEECCGNCQFYMASPKVCRRYPPKPIMVGVKQGISQISQQEPLILAYFPVMMPTGWCGEHRPMDDPEPIEN